MEVTNELLPWDSEDVAIWHAFLLSRTGQRLIPKVLESTPELLSAGEINSILIRTGEVRGVQEVARTLLSLANPPREVHSDPSASNYPALTDDSKWQDGEKLQIQP